VKHRFYSAGVVLALALTVSAAPAKAPPCRYELRANGAVVYDTQTHLEWQRGIEMTGPASQMFADGPARCAALNLGVTSVDKWRVPTLLEVLSLEDTSVVTGLHMDTAAFPATPRLPALTQSRGPRYSSARTAFLFDFETGVTERFSIDAGPTTVFLRCVRQAS
jgi:hypothetical protein